MINEYGMFSPYKDTPYKNGYLDIWEPREFTAYADDMMIELPSQYEHRPDLLANDAYGDSRLWWVFAIRNPSVIKDSIYDMVAGVKIYIPQKQKLLATLGISA